MNELHLVLVLSGLGPMLASCACKHSCQLLGLHQMHTPHLLMAIKMSTCPTPSWFKLVQQCPLFWCTYHGMPLPGTPPEYQACLAFAVPPDSVALCVACAPSNWSNTFLGLTASELESFAAVSLLALSFDYDHTLLFLEMVLAVTSGAPSTSAPSSSANPAIVVLGVAKKLGFKLQVLQGHFESACPTLSSWLVPSPDPAWPSTTRPAAAACLPAAV